MTAPWLQTSVGGAYEFRTEPATPDVDATRETVSHALAQLCRFTGHTPYPYSVAEHCVLAAQHWGRTDEEKLAILVHDAHEAFFGDISAPLKQHFMEHGRSMRFLEESCQWRTLQLLGIPPDLMHRHAALIREADLGMLLAEKEVFFPVVPRPWGHIPETPQSRAVAATLRKRREHLRTAHHRLQLAFEREEERVITENAPELPLPRAEVRFGWPSKGEYHAMLVRYS